MGRPKKIIEDFKPFDKVLVRNSKQEEWIPGFFSKKDKETGLYLMTSGLEYKECIPYAKNKELYLVVEKPVKEKKHKYIPSPEESSTFLKSIDYTDGKVTFIYTDGKEDKRETYLMGEDYNIIVIPDEKAELCQAVIEPETVEEAIQETEEPEQEVEEPVQQETPDTVNTDEPKTPELPKYYIRCSIEMFELCIKKLAYYGGKYLFDFTTHTIKYMLKTTPQYSEYDYIFYIDVNQRNIIKLICTKFDMGQKILDEYTEIKLYQ